MAYFRAMSPSGGGGGGTVSTCVPVAHHCSTQSANTTFYDLAYTNSDYVSVSSNVMTAKKDFLMFGTASTMRGTGATVAENTTNCGTSCVQVMKSGTSSYTNIVVATNSTTNRTTGSGICEIKTGDKIRLSRTGVASTWVTSDIKIYALT